MQYSAESIQNQSYGGKTVQQKDLKVFTILCVCTIVIGLIVSLLNSITGIDKILSGAWIVGLVCFFIIYIAYHIFCRRQYNKINDEYIITYRISKFWSSMYFNIHLTLLLCGGSISGFLFLKTTAMGIRLYLIVLYLVIILLKKIADIIISRKYGKEKADEMKTVMLRAAAGKPFFAKSMKAMLLSVLGLIFIRERRK